MGSQYWPFFSKIKMFQSEFVLCFPRLPHNSTLKNYIIRNSQKKLSIISNSQKKKKKGENQVSSWNSTQLEILYQVLGWTAFCSWSISFYPQVILNYRRKSVVGLNFDFLVLNMIKHSSYLIYNTSLYFSPVVQKRYREKYGSDEGIMNYKRKSTIGWSIGNIILDLVGGVLNFAQMGVESIDQGTWVNFYGNIGKTLLSLEVLFFDLLFIFQHYVLYPTKREETSQTNAQESTAPLIMAASSSSENAVHGNFL